VKENIEREPKKETIELPDWKFYKEKDKLLEILEKEQAAKFDPLIVLSDAEKALKSSIISESFSNWSYREYNRLLEALDFCLPDEYERISTYIQTKNPSEVETYIKTQKSKYHTKESDISLLTLVHKLGYGNWKIIKKNLKNTKSRFNHVLLCRTEIELKRRVDLLVKAVEKEAKEGMYAVKSVLVKEILKMKEVFDKAQKVQSDDEDEPKVRKRDIKDSEKEMEEIGAY
jgi:hypothetical protein